MEGVEIDEKIIDLSRIYFGLDESVPVATYDGRAYLNAIDGSYDVIMVDAYQDITIPFQMATTEFFTMVKEHLTEDGVMVVNMNMRGQSEGNMNTYLSDTIGTVFDCIYIADVQGSTNRELFATNNPDALSRFQKNVTMEEQEELVALMEVVSNRLVAYEPGDYIMTDDKAPVEVLSMSMIDELIRDEVAYYKNIYETQGLSAVIDLL